MISESASESALFLTSELMIRGGVFVFPIQNQGRNRQWKRKFR